MENVRTGGVAVYYHDRIVRVLVMCAVAWSVLAMSAGVYLAAELVWPTIDFGQPWLSFGRLRPLHTNGIIFGFGISALMGTAFYSVQRTSHVPLFMPKLAWIVAIGWQLGVLAGGLSLLAGFNSSKEYAELEWPFDVVITLLWVGFGIVFFGTIARRKIRPIYVSNWFYGALIIVIAMLHIVNNLALPVSMFKSYSLFSGAQDAIVQWWYGHNAVDSPAAVRVQKRRYRVKRRVLRRRAERRHWAPRRLSRDACIPSSRRVAPRPCNVAPPRTRAYQACARA
jgi:cytochrome c oxidase cbb3-type subunit 1